MMLGYLLARKGVRVTVLEKHGDFFRDFRGDTVHPSTLQIFHELDLLEPFLRLPHQRVERLSGVIGDFHLDLADFRHVPARCKFVALMPQWDFLDFLSERAKEYPQFDLRMGHEATGLINQDGRVTGVDVRTPEGMVEIEADLVVGCDGRHSIIRKAAHLEVREFGVPIDVLWFRISRQPDDPQELFGNVNYGRALVLINRNDYFQAGLIIRKGSYEEMQSAGLVAFQETVRSIAPYLGDRVEELRSWDQIKLLTVQINRLRKWHRPGLLCIGDAAHAMSPIGGVGVNMAIQDAVAAANRLAAPLKAGTASDDDLRGIEARRTFPMRFTQGLQLMIQKRIISPTLASTQRPKPPLLFKLVGAVPLLQRIPGRLLAVGVRPEHIHTPDMFAKA